MSCYDLLSSRGSFVAVTVSTLVASALAVGAFVAHKHPADMRSAALLGQKLYHPPAVAGIPASTDWGYDGQFYLTLATDPLVLRPETVEGLDNPPYRAGRMLVPLSAWLLALGHAGAATYLYLFVCWIGGWLSVPVAARYLQVQGHSPWWAWLLLPSVGLMASTLRCLPDGMGLLLFMGSLYCFARHRNRATTGLATLAILARETSWLANLGLAYEQIKARRFDAAASHLFVPLIALLLWRLFQQQRLPAWGGNALADNVGLPFAGLLWKLGELIAEPAGLLSADVWALAGLVLSLMMGLPIALRVRVHGMHAVIFVAYCGLAVLLQRPVMVEVFAFGRVLLYLPPIALMLALDETATWRRWVLMCAVACFALAGILMLAREFV